MLTITYNIFETKEQKLKEIIGDCRHFPSRASEFTGIPRVASGGR